MRKHVSTLNRLIVTFYVLCSLLLAIQSTQVASAQTQVKNFRPPISREQFERVCNELNAEDPRLRTVLSTILFDYLAEYAIVTEKAQQQFREAFERHEAFLKANPGEDGYRKADRQDFGTRIISMEWTGESERIESKFIEAVEILLTPDQSLIWNSFLRKTRRDTLLFEIEQNTAERSLYDLVAILADIELPETILIDVLSLRFEYEIALDEVLQLWRDEYVSRFTEIIFLANLRDSLGAQAPRFEDLNDRITRISNRYVELAENVADINELAKDRIASALGAPFNDLFLDRVNEKKYPKMFAPSPVEEVMALVKSDERISIQQRDSTEDIVTQHRRLVRNLRAQYIPQFDRWNTVSKWKSLQREMVKQMEENGEATDPRESHPSVKYVRRRIDLERETCRKLQVILTANSQEPLSPAIHILLTWYSDAMSD